MNELNQGAATEAAVDRSLSAEEQTPSALQEMISKAVGDQLAEAKKAWAKPVPYVPGPLDAQQLEEREQALAAREQALVRREMRSFAREQLAHRKLPEALLDALCCADEPRCLESLELVENAFRAAVQEGVVERMRGQEPARGEAAALDTMDDDAYYHFTYAK